MLILVEVEGTFVLPKSGDWTFHEHQAGFDNPVSGEEGQSFYAGKTYVLQADTLDECLAFVDQLAREYKEFTSFSLSDEVGYHLEEQQFTRVDTTFVKYVSNVQAPDYWVDADGDWVDY